LIDSVAGSADFSKPVIVPEGFLAASLPVPHPSGGTLYLKLRDDPQVVNPTRLIARELPAAPPEADRSAARAAAPAEDSQAPRPAAADNHTPGPGP
jgi:hypothetical protein